MLLDEYKKEITGYCVKNGLSADKVFSSPYAYRDNWACVTYYDPNKVFGDIITMGGEPSPVMLEIFLENGKLRFRQTEHTYRLLAEKPAAVSFARKRRVGSLAAV